MSESNSNDSSPNRRILLVIEGPTASGKTDFAIELAKFYNTEIISADSRQIYKEISIGTAKPSNDKLNYVKHHFINHCSIHDTYNAGIYEREALECITNLFKTKKQVIVAGGTGMYIKAICDGLDNLPQANPILRKQLQDELLEFGVEYLFKKLQVLDPVGSVTIDDKNPNRLMRAIEIVTSTGKSLLELKTGNRTKRPFEIFKINMNVERVTLYQRINTRVDEMMMEGLLEEAKILYEFKHLNALKTVGYSELFDFIDGKYTLQEAVEKIKQHTRNYAKRQITWFRNESNQIPHNLFKRELYF